MSSNLLSIPLKKTYPIDIKEAVRRYITDHGGVHPDEVKEDIRTWQNLRKYILEGVPHENVVESSILYHAQLISVLTKLPRDIGLPIAYAPVFRDTAIPITLNNLVFERACVLFNLAALYSQLASSEDRSNAEGIKRAAAYYREAAGTLSYMQESVLPNLSIPGDEEEIPHDLSTDFVRGLELLMQAQAQECSWQLARLTDLANSLVSKIAVGTSTLYHSIVIQFNALPYYAKTILPSAWIAHVQAKEYHFLAVAEYRQSIVEYESSRYGFELARLGNAQLEAKKAFDMARRGKVAQSVINDAQSLLQTVKDSETRAQRDNDLIYHKDVPSPSALPVLSEKVLASPSVPKGISNPDSVLGNTRRLFSELPSWGAREAINIYDDRKSNLIQEGIIQYAQELQDQIDESLRQLNLPSALEALEKPIGLPPSLLRKAEEVRREDGPQKIEATLADVSRLAQHDQTILDDALDILDAEASEDEAARNQIPLNRLKSYEANVELIQKATRYRNILLQATESDETVRQKWDEWEESITELTLDEDTLEAYVPSSTTSTAAQSTEQGKETRNHAQKLRVKLEELDALNRDREQVVHSVRSLADADDIVPRIMNASSGFERLAEVTPAMFEDVSDEELAKYDKFLLEMKDIAHKQSELLSAIESGNELFLKSRKEDPAVKDRADALQSLDLAYFKYREITRNLEEGFKFYNDLAGILVQFKEVCKNWSLQRNQELHAWKLNQSVQAMSITENDSQRESSVTPTPLPQTRRMPSHPTPSRKPPPGKSSLGLPSINSSEWGFEELTLPPPPQGKK